MNEGLIKALRLIRTELFWALNPFDYIHRHIQGKKNFPPLWLRSHVGNLYDFEGSGGEYIAYLKVLCDLKPGDRVLDIGCGCGLMTLNLTGPNNLLDYLKPPGQYVGLDIYKPAVEWAQKHITKLHSKGYPHCVFLHLDIKNEDYNPKGRWSVEEFPFPYGAEAWNIILLKSVFTHLLVDEARWYLNRIRKLLAPDGICLSTWFLLNPKQRVLGSKNLNTYDFGSFSCNGITSCVRPTRPRLTVGYEEDMLCHIIEQEGLVPEVRYGTWSGGQDGLSFQDIILLRRF